MPREQSPSAGLPGDPGEATSLAVSWARRTGQYVAVFTAAGPITGGHPVRAAGSRVVAETHGQPGAVGTACHDAPAGGYVAVAQGGYPPPAGQLLAADFPPGPVQADAAGPPLGPPCDDMHTLAAGRCLACGHLVTGLLVGRHHTSVVTEGTVPAACGVVHPTEYAATAFRWSADLLARIGRTAGCVRDGHPIPDGATSCPQCGLVIEGGTPGDRDMVAGLLRELSLGRPESGREAAAAADALAGCGCMFCGGSRDPARQPGFRGGRIPPGAIITGGDEAREQLAHAAACGDVPLDVVEAAQSRKPGPLESLPGGEPLLVAAGPGPDYEAWRHAALGVWIARPGERVVDLDGKDPAAPRLMTAGQLRAELGERDA